MIPAKEAPCLSHEVENKHMHLPAKLVQGCNNVAFYRKFVNHVSPMESHLCSKKEPKFFFIIIQLPSDKFCI